MNGHLHRGVTARRISLATGLACLLFVGGLAIAPSAGAIPKAYVTVTKGVVKGPGGVTPNWTVGSTGKFSIRVTNTGGLNFALPPGTYTVTDQLPAGMTLTSLSGAGTPTSWSCSSTGGLITCTFTITWDNVNGVPVPVVNPGQSLPPILIGVKVAQPPGPEGTYTNCAHASTSAALVSGPSCVTVKPLVIKKKPWLCVKKYSDMNGNGVQDPGEPFLSGWKFTVKNSQGATVATLVTGSKKECIQLSPGTFTVTETPQKGWTPTQPGSGSQTVSLPLSGKVKTLTFGNIPPGELCVQKFEDLDRDGVQDPDEPLLEDWQFEVTGPKGKSSSTQILTTDPEQRCLRVVPGTYVVTELAQDGWIATAPASGTQTVTVGANQAKLVTFGNSKDPCCLTFTYLGGKKDEFSTADGAEPANPIPPETQSTFDSTALNTVFTHGINLNAGTGNCITGATLEVRVKALGNSGQSSSGNDTIGLQVPGGQGQSWTLTNVQGYNFAPKTLLFDLAALPGNGNGGPVTSIISSLDSVRRLEVRIQDDTSIDYIELNVEFCECAHGSDTPTM